MEQRALLAALAGGMELTFEPTGGNEVAHGAIVSSSDAESFTDGEILAPFMSPEPGAERWSDFPITVNESGRTHPLVDVWFTRLDGAEVAQRLRPAGSHSLGGFNWSAFDLGGPGPEPTDAALSELLTADWVLPGETIPAGTTIFADYQDLQVDHENEANYYYDNNTKIHHSNMQGGTFRLFREVSPGVIETIAAWDSVELNTETDYSNFTARGTEVLTGNWTGVPSAAGRWQIDATATASADSVLIDQLDVLRPELQSENGGDVIGLMGRGSIYTYDFSFDTAGAVETLATRLLATTEEDEDGGINLIGVTDDGATAVYTAEERDAQDIAVTALYAVDTTDGTSTLLYPQVDVGRVRPILAGDGVIFLTNDLASDELRSVSITGGPSVTLFDGGLDHDTELEVSDGYVLFTNVPDGGFDARLLSVPVLGGPILELSSGLRGENADNRFSISDDGHAVFIGRVGANASPIGFNLPALHAVPLAGQTHHLIEQSGSIEVQDFQVVGNLVVYRMFDTNDGVGWQDLFSASADGQGGKRRLTPLDDGYIQREIDADRGLQYLVSPDGERVFYHYRFYNSDGSQDGLYAASTNDSTPIQRIDTRDNFRLTSSPDGSFLINEHSNFEHFILDRIAADGGGTTQIVEGYGGNLNFAISPDSSRIVYQRNNTDNFREHNVLFSEPSDGLSPPTRLTPPEHHAYDSGFVIQDDGTVFYLADPEDDGRLQLYSVPIDGSRSPRQISDPAIVPGIAGDFSSHGDQDFPLIVLSENGSVILYGRDRHRENGGPRERSLFATTLVEVPTGPVFDFGDAPDPYDTTLADDGARHVPVGVTLGANRDAESDAVQNANATGDDSDRASDDEDGVTFAALYAREDGSVTVDVQNVGPDGAYVSGWIDANGNGFFTDGFEHIVDNFFVDQDGQYTFTFPINTNEAKTTFARFRVSHDSTNDGNRGLMQSGEVEDYQVTILPQRFDFGDAPASYGISQHVLQGVRLGALRDGESEAAFSSDAMGDDADQLDDEDGVSFSTTTLTPGDQASVTLDVRDVTPSGAYLYGWVDFNRDGVFHPGAERIVDRQFVSSDGLATFTFTVPSGAVTGETFARFRVSEIASGFPTTNNPLPDGETEDYALRIVVPQDTTPPQSAIESLPTQANSLSIPLRWTARDSPGSVVSGVQSVTIQYAVANVLTPSTPWNVWQTFSDTTTQAIFPAQSDQKIWFRSIATDQAGNVEVKTAPDTRTRVGDFDPPVSEIVLASVGDNAITLRIRGQDPGSSVLERFEIYASIDGAVPQRVGSVSPEATEMDPQTGQTYQTSTFVFPGSADGIERQYVFYSIGIDRAGNSESAPTSANADVSLTHAFDPQPLAVVGFDVQKGLQQRSYIDTLDLTFNSNDAAVLQALIDQGRFSLQRFAIDSDAGDIGLGTGQAVSLAAATFEIRQGSTVRITLPANLLNSTGNPFMGNGLYRLSVDTDASGSLDAEDSHLEFFKRYGDRTGDGRVDNLDQWTFNAVTRVDLNNDLNGDGVVDRNDQRITATVSDTALQANRTTLLNFRELLGPQWYDYIDQQIASIDEAMRDLNLDLVTLLDD